MQNTLLHIDGLIIEIKNRLKLIPEEINSCSKKIIEEIYKTNIHLIESSDPLLPIKKIEKIILRKAATSDKSERELIRKTIVMQLAEGLSKRVEKKTFPNDVLKLYYIYIERFLNDLSYDNYSFDNNSYVTALRFMMLLTIPCGAQLVELNSKVPLKSIIKDIVLTNNISILVRYLKIKGWGRWYRIHTDSDYLKEFNEKGWEICYNRISQILKNDINAKGMVGTSWFYDPQLINISPRLSYLQRTPLKNGAFRIKHGPGAIHTERATMTSKTRLQYYNNGKYIPTCYSIIWPRKELIHWCNINKTHI